MSYNLDNASSPRDDIILDSMCLNELGYNNIVNYHNNNTPRQKLNLLREKFRRSFAACNFDWDAVVDDSEFRQAVCFACYYGMRFRGDKPVSEPDDIDLELP